MTTPAAELRQSAEKLRREAASAHRASPSPWAVTAEHVVRCADGMVVADRSSTDHPAERADLLYIALMGPGVGLAVADWLDAAADGLTMGRIHGTNLVICESCCEEMPCQHIRPALAVARQILGTTTAAALCGKTVGVSGLFYRPCVRPAGHPEAYCRDASGDHMFLSAEPSAPPAPVDQAATTTADRAAALGMTPTDYRTYRHAAAVERIREAAGGLLAETGLRVMDALDGATGQQPEAAPVNRAEVLREAADRVDATDLPQDHVDMFDNGARWATAQFRRMADEAQPETVIQPPTTKHSYRLEHRYSGETTWRQGTPGIGARWSYAVRAKADQRLTEAREQWPQYEHRMVTITTTVAETVTAETAPAVTEETTR